MTQKSINLGTADKGNGDPLRVAFGKVNDNFTELYTALGLIDNSLNLGAFEFTGSVMTTTDSTAIVIDQAVTVSSNLSVGGDILPQTANGGDLGSSTLPWRSLYVSNNTIYIGGNSLGLDNNGNLAWNGSTVAHADGEFVRLDALTDVNLGSPQAGDVLSYQGGYWTAATVDRLINGAYSVNLESGGVLRANVQGIVSDNQLAVEGSTLISIQTLDGPYLQLFNQGATKEINLVAWDGESLSAPTWSFDTDRTLTLPNDSSIKSATNIDITVDTPDSSTFNWQFGADGALTFPDGTAQTTAYTGGGGGGGSTLVNGANTVSLGSTGILTFPNGLLKIAGNKIRNVNESVGLIAGSEIEVTVAKTVISNGVTDTEGPSNQHIFEVGSTRIFSAYQVINTLGDGEGGPSLTGQQLTELTSTGFQIGQRVINDPGGEGEPLTSFSGWTFGTVGQSQAITFPDSTVQSTAWNGSVGDLRSEGNINIDINLADSTLRRWQFGEDGNLTFPDGTNQSTAYTGGGGSGSTLVNGANTVSLGSDGSLTIPGGITGNNDINITVDNDDSSTYTWNFGQTGDLTAPGDITTGTNDGRFIQDCAAGTTSMRWINMNQGSNSAQLIRAYTGDPKLNTGVERAQIKLNWDQTEDKSGLTIRTFDQSDPNNQVDHDWLFTGDGDLTIPGDIQSEEDISIRINLADSTTHTWRFGEDGNLTLPQGGNISEGGGISGAIKLTPSGGANANQALLIYPTGFAEGDHLHLTAGGGATELYLGDDYHYVKLVDGGNVEIKATTANFSDTAAWTFGTDGSLTSDDEFTIKTPNGVPTSVYNYSGDGGWNSPPYNDLATTTNGSGTGLTVNVSTAVGGYIDINAITINTPGTGYKTGDLITITNENSLTGTFVVGIAGTRDWQFGIDGNITLPTGKGIQSVVDGGFQSSITLNPYRVLSQTVVPGNQSYSDSGGFVSATWTDDGFGSSTIAFTSPESYVVNFISTTLLRYSSVTVRINGAGAEYPYSYFNGTNEIYLTGAPAISPTAVTEIRFSYQRISKIHIEPDDAAFDIISQPGTDIDIDAGDDLRLTAYDTVDITAGGQLSITTNEVVDARVWEFGTSGQLTLPNGAVLRNTANGAVAFGQGAGLNSQGATAIAIGNDAGYYPQGADAVAIGRSAGESYQGANAIAIGLFAGQNNQAANSIVLNATGVALEQTTANTFTVAPIRNISATSGVLQYNASTKEVSYSLNVTAETFNTDQITLVGNRISTTVTNANLELECNGTGGVVVNGGKIILNTGGNAYVESVDYGVNSANSAVNIFGGPYQKINLRAGFGTQATWTFGTDGSLTLPIGVSIDSSVSALYPKIIADSGKLFSVQGQGSTGSAALAWSLNPNTDTQYAAVGVNRGGGDDLAKVVLTAGNTTATLKVWKFDQTGAFTFPDNTVQTTAWTGTTTGAITAESFNTDQITIVGNRISTTVTNANLEIECNGTGGVVINTVAEATTASTARSVGYLGIPASTVTTTATLTIADAGEHIYLTSTGQTITIPANASVAYPIGTTLTFIAGPSATTTTIAITTDTMYLAGTGTTGSRTLAAHGMATAVKVAATTWYINGTGLT